MEVNFLTQNDIGLLEAIKEDIEQCKDEWSDTRVETVKEVLNPYIDKVRNGIEEASKLVKRTVAVIEDTDMLSPRTARKEKSVDTSALSKELTRGNDLLGLCKKAYCCLEFVRLKVHDAICDGSCDVDQGMVLVRSVIDIGDMFDMTAAQLSRAYRVLTYHPTTVQCELDELTQQCLDLFKDFLNDDKLFSADNVAHDIEIFREYQRIIHRVEERSINESSNEVRESLEKQVQCARQTESEILNKLKTCFDVQCKNFSELVSKENFSEEDADAVTACLNYIANLADYYTGCYYKIHDQLTKYCEFSDNDLKQFVRKDYIIDVDEMQTAVINCCDITSGLVRCMNNLKDKLHVIEQAMATNGNGNQSFHTCAIKFDAAKIVIDDFIGNFTLARRAFEFSPLRTQQVLDNFNNDAHQIVVNIGGKSHHFEKGSFKQLLAFSQCENLFGQFTRKVDIELLKMFEVLMLSTITECQLLLNSHGLDVIQETLGMIEHAKGCIEAIHEKAVIALGENDQFVKESTARVEDIKKLYNNLLAIISSKCGAKERIEGDQIAEDGMDANGVKNLFAQYRKLQNVSGEGLNCMFNAIRLQKNEQDQEDTVYGIETLRSVARTDESNANGWQADVSSLPNLSAFLGRPMMVLIDQIADGANGTGVNVAFPDEDGCQVKCRGRSFTEKC